MIKTAKKLLSKLREENIKLVLKDNNLEIISYQDIISSDLILEVKNQKQSLIDYLQSKNDNAFLSIPVVEANKHYPLSSAQKRLWISSQFGDNSISYNMPSIKQLEGTYDIEYFIKAIDSVIERHEILRTVFRKDDQGEIRQWILDTDELNFVVEYKDFRFEKNKEELVEAYVAQDAKKQFDLEHGPLIRASLFRVSEEQYLFYYNMHHIISDGWSMDIIAKDVLAYYTTYKNGIECSLPELRIQYKDYAAWQLAQLETKASGLHRSYWLDCLSGGELPLLDLPSQKHRPKIKSYNGCNLSTYISPEATNKLKMYSQNQGGSLFIGLLATWNILFHRYTSQKDIIIGTPVAGRNHIDLDDQIGFYVNTLALRNQLNSEESFESVFQRIKTSTLEAYDHQMYPFDSLLDDLELNRDISRNPIFDVMLALQNTGNKVVSRQIDDSTIDSIIIEKSVIAKFDLSITFKEIGDYLTFNINYNTDVYECDMVEGLMKHYKQLLNNLLDFPYKNIGEIDLLTEHEEKELLFTFNNTKTAYSEHNTTVDLFAKQVQQTPNKTAIVFNDKKITYKELDELSNQIASYLFDQGVKKGDLVPVYLDRSIEFIAAVFGILKSGGAYLPIDISYPEARVKFMLEDSGAKYILTSTTLFSFQEFKTINPLYIEQISNYNPTSEPKKTKLNSDQLAYVIYTSGSTGKPKGVMITHNSLVNYIDSQTKYFDFDSSENVLQFSNFSFDASVEQIFLTLLNGASLFLLSRDQLLNPSLLPELFKKYEITHFHSTPSYIEQLGSLENCTSLKRIVAGGDRCSIELAKNTPVFCDFYNKYGLTEATISSTIHKYRPTLDERKVLSIGSPMKNAQVYILSEMLKLQPIGVVGEICVSGIGLSKGYLHREELTNAKFISHPFLLDERLYKTGDLGCWLPDGSIEFVGRIDDQVKIRGHRIELGEIEYHLKSKSEISDAIVVSRDTFENKDLVAYLVSQIDLDTTSLRDYLSKKLPDYMLPNHYIQLSAIPLTINGKVDKNSLPDPIGSSLSTGVGYIAPRNVKESVLIKVWSDVLNRDSIGIKDNFYNLGGDSIKSIQVVSRLKPHGYCLKVEQILHHPVLEDLAKLMNENTKEIDQSMVTGAVELTPIQHYFFNNPFIVVPNHYNQYVLLKATFNIDQEILDRSISMLVAHHDALRMVYRKEEDGWSQFNTKISDRSYKICFYDLRSEEYPLDTMARLGEELQASFNLESGPLFAVGHFRLEDGDRLGLIAHHLIVDGVSWRILLEDLSTLYEGNRLNIDVNLPLKTDSFQTWASLQKELVLSNKMDVERLYWEDISSTSVSSIPTKSEVTDVHIKYNGLETILLDQKTTELLQTQVHSVYNTEINDILLTALGLAIRNVFGLEKTVVEMEGHGREDIIDGVDVSRTIGWFTTIYPFILDLSDSSNPTSALIEVKEALRKIPNKGIGFGMLKSITEGFKEDIKPSIGFNYLGDFGSKIGDSEETLFEYSSEDIGASSNLKNGQSIFLSISGMIVSEHLRMSIHYCKSLLDTEVMQLLASSYKNCLTVLIENLAVEKKSYLTPSDITFKGLTKEELWAINYDYNVEDVYKLSPLQKGIFHHWLSDSSSAMYLEQMSYRLIAKQLDVSIVKKTYDQLVLRHPVLRTSFTNDYRGESLQIVRKKVPSNFSYEKKVDISKGGDIEEYVSKVKLDDRSRYFDLEEPSQMRLKVLDLGSGAYEFIWSHHHILMDRWCISILINDFHQMLNAASQNKILNLPVSPIYSSYIDWLDKINRENSLKYWKEYLKGYDTSVCIPFKNIEIDEKSYKPSHEVLQIEGDTFAKINELCSNLGITQNIFMQGIWGYLLSKYNRTKDVVFGSMVSGRPGELIGVEDMIGLFINTIPVRIKYSTSDTPVTLLKAIHKDSTDSDPHHYLNLSEVLSQNDLGMDLIDHILVFENNPVREGIKEYFETNQENNSFDIAAELIDITERTNYDFDIIIGASDSSLSIKFNYNNSVYTSESINILANHFSRLIDGFIANPNQKLSRLT